MLFAVDISAQSSLGLTGLWSDFGGTGKSMNGLESGPAPNLNLKDWGLTLSYGGEKNSSVSSTLYMAALSKKIGGNLFYIRYTPGYQKSFVFNSSESILLSDSSSQPLDSKFSYKESFGLGYSYGITKNLRAGFSLRYFTQQFDQDNVRPVFSDTVYLVRESSSYKADFWRGEVGLTYMPADYLLLSVSSINLFNVAENSVDPDVSRFELKQNKGVMIGASASLLHGLSLNLIYETTDALQTGLNYEFNALGGNAGIGITAFHDKYQTPYIAGIIPAVYFSYGMFDVTLSAVSYLSKRSGPKNFTDFEDRGIRNVINNQYSYNKAVLTFGITLNTVRDRLVKFLDINVLNEIYPTLADNYFNKPFATGKVVNLTDRSVTVKPMSRIEGIEKEFIQSPTVVIGPKDTADVPFYTTLPDNYNKTKAEISYVDFHLNANSDDIDDKLQKPVLIQGRNAWDGNVTNLKYFIKKGYDFSMSYSRKILSEYKTKLDTLPYVISNFYKAKILFNSFIGNMVYTSDPRASADYVQFPGETIKLRGGDCDDLSVLYSSLLESVGIQTALVDYKPEGGDIGHVNVLVNTGLNPEQAGLITANESKYFIRKDENGKDEVWICVETTTLTNFNEAWDQGASKFDGDALTDLGLAKGRVNIVDIF